MAGGPPRAQRAAALEATGRRPPHNEKNPTSHPTPKSKWAKEPHVRTRPSSDSPNSQYHGIIMPSGPRGHHPSSPHACHYLHIHFMHSVARSRAPRCNETTPQPHTNPLVLWSYPCMRVAGCSRLRRPSNSSACTLRQAIFFGAAVPATDPPKFIHSRSLSAGLISRSFS